MNNDDNDDNDDYDCRWWWRLMMTIIMTVDYCRWRRQLNITRTTLDDDDDYDKDGDDDDVHDHSDDNDAMRPWSLMMIVVTNAACFWHNMLTGVKRGKLVWNKKTSPQSSKGGKKIGPPLKRSNGVIGTKWANSE